MITLTIEVDTYCIADFCGEQKQLVPGDKVSVSANAIESMYILPVQNDPEDLPF